MTRNRFHLPTGLAWLTALALAIALPLVSALAADDEMRGSSTYGRLDDDQQQSPAESRAQTAEVVGRASPQITQTPEGQNQTTDPGTELRIETYTGSGYPTQDNR